MERGYLPRPCKVWGVKLIKKFKEVFELDFIDPMFYDPIHSLGINAGNDEVSGIIIWPLNGAPIEGSVEYALAYANGSSIKTELQLTNSKVMTTVLGHQVDVTFHSSLGFESQ